MDVGTVFTSVVLAAVVSGLISLWINDRKLAVENTTKERAAWRREIRRLALAVHRALVDKDAGVLNELSTQFSLMLNPLDSEDRGILRVIAAMKASEADVPLCEEFVARVSLLLKHDWERSKWEATSVFSRNLVKPKRIAYEDHPIDAVARGAAKTGEAPEAGA